MSWLPIRNKNHGHISPAPHLISYQDRQVCLSCFTSGSVSVYQTLPTTLIGTMIITIIISVVIKRGVTSNMRGCCIFGPLTRECAVRPEPARSPTTKLAPPLRRLLSRALTFAEKVRRVVLGLGHLDLDLDLDTWAESLLSPRS